MSAQPHALRTVLRKAPVASPAPSAAVASTSSGGSQAEEGDARRAERIQGPEPYSLLDAATWQMTPQTVAEVLTTNQDFSVVGVLGDQGLGKSAFLNRLLGLSGELPVSGPHPTSAFPLWTGAAAGGQRQAWQHCTRGAELRVSADRLLAVDTQPLFSTSVLADMVALWDTPPPALAAPAVAAAGEGKATEVPFEGVHVLAQLQLAVLLLSTCHRVLVFCEGWHDCRTWDFLQTAEMLARGIPDPSLPPPDPQQTAAAAAMPAGAVAGAGAGAAVPLARHAPPLQEHLAEVVLVSVVPAGGSDSSSGRPIAARLQLLERQLDAFFASSRLRQPGALRMLEYMQGSGRSSSEGMSYWVLPALQHGSGCGGEDPPGWAELVAALLARPCPPFARCACTEQQWLRGVAGESWWAVRKSVDLATFYSRLARTQLKGGGGWGLAR